MENNAPFTQDKFNQIFSVSLSDNSHLVSRESSMLEFKLSFGWNSLPQYLKTCAAFANNKGGYIVFGISNSPHRLVGLQPVSLQLFETIDAAQITAAFNNHFAPEIRWEHDIYKLDGHTYGLLYVYESMEKPVVCIKNNSDELKEGDILYRYRARAQRIKYAELRSILEQTRRKEQESWMNHLSRIAKIGVENTGIFNISSGEVTGKNGNSFIIDESLLSQLSFIKEGEFNEIQGKPTLRLIGNLEPVETIPLKLGSSKVVKVPVKGIRQSDIILGFLSQQPTQVPKDYLTQICFESTALLPIYYYMHLGRFNENKVVEILDSVISRSPAKKRIIERVKKRTIHALPMGKGVSTEMSIKKREYLRKILNNQIEANDVGIEDLNLYLKAILALSSVEITTNKDVILVLLRTWFDRYYINGNQTIADSLRRSICWVDEALYMAPII